MHNLHLFVIKAESAKDACNDVETIISDFGNENNWRTVCGCVSEKNKVFINSIDGRYSPKDTGYTTIAKINRAVQNWIKHPFFGDVAKRKLANAKKKINLATWNSQELFSLERLARHLYEAHPFKEKKFNILEDSFYAYQYNECGVTQDEGEHEGEGQTLVVFIDMHD